MLAQSQDELYEDGIDVGIKKMQRMLVTENLYWFKSLLRLLRTVKLKKPVMKLSAILQLRE